MKPSYSTSLRGLSTPYKWDYRFTNPDVLRRLTKSRFYWPWGKRRKQHDTEVSNAALEIEVLRKRVQAMAHELNSWRWVVGGVAYKVDGPTTVSLVLNDLRNKTGQQFVRLTDQDFLG